MKTVKKLGQHFLINPKIADFIVDIADLKEFDTVLEIGPGKGILTKRLLKKCKVIAVEIDELLCEYLSVLFQREIEQGKLTLICGDVLKVRLPQFTKVVANIPYNISSPLIFKIMNHRFDSAVLMLQKEFAERLCATPGSKKYGRLSVMMYYHGDAEIVKRVRRGNFRPIPKVDSAIVKIIRKERFCEEREILEKVVRSIFSQRRKKIKNILGDVPYGDKRAEELTPENICEVARYVKDRLSR